MTYETDKCEMYKAAPKWRFPVQDVPRCKKCGNLIAEQSTCYEHYVEILRRACVCDAVESFSEFMRPCR